MVDSRTDTQLNRGTGLLIIEARFSNPNGDPDTESDPRTMSADDLGLISPVSFKRKLRDMVINTDGPVWQEAERVFGIADQKHSFSILEERGRNRDDISKMDVKSFTGAYWDARVFGNTFLESMKQDGTKKGEKEHFISTGVVQFGPGVSVSPIAVERLTFTNKAGVEEKKDRGMAPLGWRVVRHAVYAMPFFVNPMMAKKTGCTILDIELMKFLIPHAYRNTASAVRSFIEIRHAWFAEHKTPLGSCPDSLIIDALTPEKVKGEKHEPSTSIDEYSLPDKLPDEILNRLSSLNDLCEKQWSDK